MLSSHFENVIQRIGCIGKQSAGGHGIHHHAHIARRRIGEPHIFKCKLFRLNIPDRLLIGIGNEDAAARAVRQRLRGWKDGYGAVYTDPFEMPGLGEGPTDLGLVLSRGSVLPVRVRGPDGRPVKDAWVYVTDAVGRQVPLSLQVSTISSARESSAAIGFSQETTLTPARAQAMTISGLLATGTMAERMSGRSALRIWSTLSQVRPIP